MDRQTLRDWAHRFNAEGIEGLSDRNGKGAKPIMQFHDKIKAVGAYFRSLTTGSKKSEGFSPEKLIRRLATAQNYAT
jgi:hypothetical protein